MNLAENPTKDALRALLIPINDNAGTHVIWVSHSGSVCISILPDGLTPIGFEEATPTMKFRLESLGCGNGYTGAAAAEDEKWIERLFAVLNKSWEANATGYIYEF